jgi:AAA domain (dynein-related subfamily)
MTDTTPDTTVAAVETHDAVSQALAIAVAAGVPVVLTGKPGCGKTAAVNELARAQKRYLACVIASLREPSDFAGLPVVEGRSTFMAPPAWAKAMAEHTNPILFLDEVSTAPQSVQAALLRVVDEGVVGELALPPGTATVAAMNPPDSAAGGWDLAAAFSNRWLHLEWRGWGARQWSLWAARQGWGQPGQLIGAFLLAHTTLLHAMPDDAAGRGQPWPSHRTWARACTVAHQADKAGMDLTSAVGIHLTSGCVGNAAALELAQYVQELDLPDPRKLLADPDSWVVPQRADRVWATLSNLARYVLETGKRKDWERAWEVMVIANASDDPAYQHGDLAVAASVELAKHMPRGAKVPKALTEFMPLLQAAGLVEVPQ